MQKPTREDVREAWHAMDEARKTFEKRRAEFDRLRNARYPTGTPTEAEMQQITVALGDV